MPAAVRARPLAALAAAAALAAVAPGAQAQSVIQVGTDDHNGAYYRAGGGICKLVNAGRNDHQMRCRVIRTPGGVDNIRALRRGERALGFASADLARDAVDGAGAFDDTGGFDGLRAVSALHHETVTVVARDGADIERIDDLTAGRVNLGPEGSGTRATLGRLMDAFGWAPNDFRDTAALSPSEQVDALCGGDLDAAIFVTAHPSGNVRDALDCGGELIPLEGAAINNMVGDSDSYTTTGISADHYDDVNDEVASYSVATLLLSSTNTDRNTVYEVTAALFENLDEFRGWHPALGDLEAGPMAERTRDSGVTLHPGARQYFDEADP